MNEIIEMPRRLWTHSSIRFHPQPINIGAQSPFTGQRSVFGPIARAWLIEWTTPPLADWRELESILMRLGGTANRLRVGNPVKCRPRFNQLNATRSTFTDGSAFSDGSVFVGGGHAATARIGEAAAAEATSIVIEGLVASQTPALYWGDLLEIRPSGIAAEHGHLYQVVQLANSDGAGAARANIVPGLRAAVAVGDQVVLDHPTSVFRAVDDDQGIAEHPARGFRQFGFALLEVLP